MVYLLSADLADTKEPGIRLVPVVVFVQRIIRLLREAGQDLKTLVDRRRLFQWYLKAAHNEKEADMLLQAYQQCSIILLLDGIDEAAGERGTIEEFVHYELVPSGNRIV
eukprot:248767-Prymnesium_polylepis.1